MASETTETVVVTAESAADQRLVAAVAEAIRIELAGT